MTSPARSFLARVSVNGWDKLSTAEQCATPFKDRRVAGWLMVTGRLRPSPDHLVLGKPYLGEIAARHHRVFHQRFITTSAELGFAPRVSRLQWSGLVKVAVLVGLSPEQITTEALSAGRAALITTILSTDQQDPARRT